MAGNCLYLRDIWSKNEKCRTLRIPDTYVKNMVRLFNIFAVFTSIVHLDPHLICLFMYCETGNFRVSFYFQVVLSRTPRIHPHIVDYVQIYENFLHVNRTPSIPRFVKFSCRCNLAIFSCRKIFLFYSICFLWIYSTKYEPLSTRLCSLW